jgi:hypothetical protein
MNKLREKSYLDKILFILACTYLAISLSWLISQNKVTTSGVSQNTNQSPEKAKFIAYLQRSLDKLESKKQLLAANSPQASRTNPSPTPLAVKVPPPPPITNPASIQQKQPTVVEKIYIPVYPQNQPQIQYPTTIPKPITIPPPPPVTTPPRVSTVPVLTPGGNGATSSVVPSLPSPKESNTLVGLLEAGEKSSALFNLNGTTRKIELGGIIGSSGWTLKSIENQRAIIFRNGKLRTLEVGQGL